MTWSAPNRLREWKLPARTLTLGGRTLVMGVLNPTPDSFSDGGRFYRREAALAHAEAMIEEGADIIDVGGESTRPGSCPVAAEEELRRVLPAIEHLAKTARVAVSIDTTKAAVARVALDAGAEIVNDVSGLRFEPALAGVVAGRGAGLILMHSRGAFETMHAQEPVEDVISEVERGWRESVEEAERRGVRREKIVLDPGIGFGKTRGQNVELIAKLDDLARAFPGFPLLVGASRKSFIGALLVGANVNERVHGTMASVTAAILRGVQIVRVHDVRAAVETARVADAIKAATEKVLSTEC